MPASSPDHGIADTAPSSPFLCPGETVPVSRAVHLARLYAGWSGCDRCPWNTDLEGLAESSRNLLATIRERRRDGIVRTEFGVRGVWQNQISRSMAGALIRVFCDALLRGSSASSRTTQSHPTDTDSCSEPQRVRLLPVAMGYDDRASSLDIFAGVAAAVREFGFPVIDIGRCTAASLVEAIRSIRDVQAGVIVTGSGASAAWTGFDVLDGAGDPIAVRWKDYGIRVMSIDTAEAGTSPATAVKDGRRSGRSIPGLHLLDVRSPESLTTRLRATRDFGPHQQLAFEQRYRDSLLRWYPEDSRLTVQISSADPLLRQRVDWLASTRKLNLISANPGNVTADSPRAIRLEVSDDDRQFLVTRAHGEPVSADQLALRINSAIRSGASQVTAHADPATNRFWLTDAARPGSASGCENIADALAVAGLIMRLSSGNTAIV